MTTLKLILAAGISAVALSSAAIAQDLVIADAPAGYAAGNFDGGFVGAFGGGMLAGVEFPTIGETLIPFDLDPEGWLLGVDAGFNFALGNGLVLGVVGDIAYADVTDSFGLGFSGISSNIDWVGSVRARAGFDAGNFMPYLTAGIAAAHNTIEFSSISGEPGPDPVEPTTLSSDATHVGWTLGAGVEFAVAESLSIDVGYRYNDYGAASYSMPFGGPDEPVETSADLGLTSHQLTVGLHYGF